MSLFKRGGVWWYDFQIPGVRVRETSGFTSKSEAARAEALRKAGLIQSNGNLKVDDPEPRFGEFALTEFAPWSENEHREHPSTHHRYMRSVKVLVRYFGQKTLDMITSAEVERFKIARSRERRKFATDGRHVTPAAVNRDLAALRILFNFAIRLNKARTNPVAGVKLLAEYNLHMRVVSPEEESAYLAAASQPLRDVATIILETGMRPGEVFTCEGKTSTSRSVSCRSRGVRLHSRGARYHSPNAPSRFSLVGCPKPRPSGYFLLVTIHIDP